MLICPFCFGRLMSTVTGRGSIIQEPYFNRLVCSRSLLFPFLPTQLIFFRAMNLAI